MSSFVPRRGDSFHDKDEVKFNESPRSGIYPTTALLSIDTGGLTVRVR
jgi:hypothetical protein